jgi:hypothetical protein
MIFKPGDKVKIKSKHGTQEDLIVSKIYNRMIKMKQNYVYVIYIETYNFGCPVYVLNVSMNEIGGDYYEEQDVESYLKEERKQKLLKLNEIQNYRI